jgi:unsaturated rhamnogalacturonyl hydrolase
LAHLSPKLQRQAIAKAMRKVGDWELKRARENFDQDWTFAALYAGFMAASATLPYAHYEAAMLDAGNKFEAWSMPTIKPPARPIWRFISAVATQKCLGLCEHNSMDC